MPDLTLRRLHQTLAGVCPIDGVSGVQGTVRVDYSPSATAPQIAAAESALAAFDWSAGAQSLWVEREAGARVGIITPVRLIVNRQNDQTSLADVTGLSFQLRANSHYAFSFVGAYTAAAGTTGIRFAVNGPASPVLVRVVGHIATSASASAFGAVGAYETLIAATASGGATALPFWIEGNISTNSAGGIFTLRFSSEVASSAVTVLAGAYGLLYGVG